MAVFSQINGGQNVDLLNVKLVVQIVNTGL